MYINKNLYNNLNKISLMILGKVSARLYVLYMHVKFYSSMQCTYTRGIITSSLMTLCNTVYYLVRKHVYNFASAIVIIKLNTKMLTTLFVEVRITEHLIIKICSSTFKINKSNPLIIF